MASLLAFLCIFGFSFWTSTNAWDESKWTVSNELFDSLEELARLVDISYCVGTTGIQKPFQCLSHCAEFPDLELVTTWNTGVLLSDSCGYVALSHPPSPKRILVAFRGTYSLTNTIIDLLAYPQSYVPYPGDSHDQRNGTKLPSAPRCENCTVHAGFMTSWLNTRSVVLSSVSAAREKFPDYEVTLVGHSLGGAVAALAGLEMRLKGWDPQVTSFGEPMVGNGAFVQFLNQHFQLSSKHSKATSDSPRDKHLRFRRVTHVGDPVPLLPLQEWDYEAHAGEIFISKQDLPPSIEDLQPCVGNCDPRCIAGPETTDLLRTLKMDPSIHRPVSVSSCPPSQDDVDLETADQAKQVILGQRTSRGRSSPADCDRNQANGLLHSIHWDWSIPARYRIWQLFCAHRDYFWRIGLCIPGGDPTG
ncbi:hypothetical protein NUU61_008921 [Penicillium alfredii]|uniref:Fungal lipase-type domain-containing protein n=1 Tax=Penicillium alfredii TaxID=1506179 RepID=A0A9W9EM25_9EURO|nr:uncharacterized protein NUU61_008921 [Penicillium alfredii]KAJ5084342.1 hypothetical protein NUU61_008921 [Penicillium alfredii]